MKSKNKRVTRLMIERMRLNAFKASKNVTCTVECGVCGGFAQDRNGDPCAFCEGTGERARTVLDEEGDVDVGTH